MFEGFAHEHLPGDGVDVFVRHGGEGPAVLLIHGHPRRFAQAWFHWFFLAQPELPERVINADPDAWYRGTPPERRAGGL